MSWQSKDWGPLWRPGAHNRKLGPKLKSTVPPSKIFHFSYWSWQRIFSPLCSYVDRSHVTTDYTRCTWCTVVKDISIHRPVWISLNRCRLPFFHIEDEEESVLLSLRKVLVLEARGPTDKSFLDFKPLSLSLFSSFKSLSSNLKLLSSRKVLVLEDQFTSPLPCPWILVLEPQVLVLVLKP